MNSLYSASSLARSESRSPTAFAVGTAAQASTSAVMLGIAVLAPEVRTQFHLTLGETGVVLAALAQRPAALLVCVGGTATVDGGIGMRAVVGNALDAVSVRVA